MFTYQDSVSSQTLRNGIDEFRQGNEMVSKQGATSSMADEFFSSHDACHVLFRLNTSLQQEALVDAWMLFGTTATLAHFKGYVQLEEHKEIIKKNGYLVVITTFLRALPNILRIIWHSHKMFEKWPWESFHHYLDVSLKQLREQFNVKLIGTTQAT